MMAPLAPYIAQDRLCMCGCGQVTARARRGDLTRGTVKGQPRRYCPGHYRGSARLQGGIPCDVESLDSCAGPCGRQMHRVARYTCVQGHRAHNGRGLCEGCYRALKPERARFPRMVGTRDRTLNAWVDLAEMGVSFAEFPARFGTTFGAWERLFFRARKAGDARAVRIDRGELYVAEFEFDDYEETAA